MAAVCGGSRLDCTFVMGPPEGPRRLHILQSLVAHSGTSSLDCCRCSVLFYGGMLYHVAACAEPSRHFSSARAASLGRWAIAPRPPRARRSYSSYSRLQRSTCCNLRVRLCNGALVLAGTSPQPRADAAPADDSSSVHWPAGTRMLQHAGLCCNVLYRTGRRRQVHRRKARPMWPAARAAGSTLSCAARTECCRATCCASSRPLRVRGSARQRRTRGSPLPHLRQDWTHARHICTRTGGLMCSLQLAR